MNEYREKQTMFQHDGPIRQARPIEPNRPVVSTQYDSVVHDHRDYEPRAMSGGAIVALVLAAVAAAVAVTLLIVNGQQRSLDEDLAQERAKNAAMQAQPSTQPAQVQPQQQPQQQPPPMATAPSQQVPAPAVMPSTMPPVPAAPTSAEIEMEVASKLLADPDLHILPIEVKVAGGIATLSGKVPSDEQKTRAEIVAIGVKGVRKVVNNITVQPD